MQQPITLTHEINRLGPFFGVSFEALVVLIMLALLFIGVWGVVKGSPGVRAREPLPG